MGSASYKRGTAMEFHTISRYPRGQANVLQIQPRFWYVHVTDDAISFRGSVPIGASARNEVKLLGEPPEALCVCWSVTRMPHFHSIQAQRVEACQALPGAVTTRVRPNGESARGMREANCVGYFEAWLGNVRDFAGAEVLVEGVAMIRDVARLDHSTRNVRSPECGTRSFGENVIDLHRNASRRKPIDDCVTAFDAFALKSFEAWPDRAGVLDVQCEKVNLKVTIIRTQFAAADHTDAETRTCCERFVVASNGIVIGDRDRVKPCTNGSLDKLCWRYSTVRGR